MADLLDTDKLRDIADDGDDRAQYIETHSEAVVRRLTAAVRAAADEVDVLRGRVKYFKTDRDVWHRHAVANERTAERLQAVIDNAPHDYDHICTGDDPLIVTECTCWKAEAMRESTDG